VSVCDSMARQEGAKMRTMTLWVLLITTATAHADTATFSTGIGADFQHQSDAVANIPNGISLGGYSDSGGRFSFSNPLAPYVSLAAYEGMGTGGLVSQTDTSWTFSGGGVVAEPDGEGATFIPLPSGYATCEAAGFGPSYFDGQCTIWPSLFGTITGNVVLTLGAPRPATGEFQSAFELTGPVTFDISDDLARAAGVVAGPYVGSVTVQGMYSQYSPYLNDEQPPDYQLFYDFFQVSGTSVPEPSTFIFLFTAIAICAVFRLHLHTRRS
jgi:hypothetical protein